MNKSTDLVSVIIPTYNRPCFLIEALESVRAQSHRPVEVIIIDDGSSSNNLSIVKDYINSFEAEPCFFIFLIEQHHLGQCVARNRGLAQSQGKYIQFLDDDDTLHPKKLSIQLHHLKKNSELDVVVAQIAYCDSDLNPMAFSNINDRGWKGSMVDFFLELSHDVQTHAPLHRRSVLEKIGGFDESGKFGDDVSLHLRLAISGAKFSFIPDVLGYFRGHKQTGRVTDVGRCASVKDEEEFYKRIIDFSEKYISGRNHSIRRGVANRVFSIACRNYAHCKLKTGNDLIKLASKFCPELKFFELKIYPGMGGFLGFICEGPKYLFCKLWRKIG